MSNMNMRVGFVKAKQKMILEGLTTEDVARALGISRVNMSYKLNGMLPWSLRDLYLFGDVCGIPDRDLLSYFPKTGVVVSPKKERRKKI